MFTKVPRFADPIPKCLSLISVQKAASTATMKTTTFFSLPRELRDCVYKHYIYAPCKPPATPRHAGLRLHEDCDSSGIDWKERHILYPLDARPDAYIIPLLQCNWQVRREVNEALSRAKAHNDGDGSCKLDLMFARKTLVPTWIGFPSWPEHIRRLEISIRIFDHYITADLFARIFNLLMHHGPQFGYSNLHQETNLHLQTLTIKIAFDEGMQHTCHAERELIEYEYFEDISDHFDNLLTAGVLTGLIHRISVRVSSTECDYEAKPALKNPPDDIPGDPAESALRWGVDTSLKITDWLDKKRWVQAE